MAWDPITWYDDPLVRAMRRVEMGPELAPIEAEPVDDEPRTDLARATGEVPPPVGEHRLLGGAVMLLIEREDRRVASSVGRMVLRAA